MVSFSKKLQELRRIARLHGSWLVYATLGESALTEEEVTELTEYGKLPMGKTLDLVDKSYLLGRLRAVLKRSEYRDLSYEEVNETSLSTTSLEDLVLEQARLKAGKFLKGVAADITDGAFEALSTSMGEVVTEVTVRQMVADETALALISRKTVQQLASSLATRLQTNKKNWTTVAQTELHSAKIAGTAQAIINKVDIYAMSGGPDANVSIVPAPGCEDCRAHYIGLDGNPTIFRLVDLISAGSNSDSGVSHTKSNKIHTKWKTTLPPLHPSCGCQLVFVPPGHSWVNGKLEMLNKSLFDEALAKAQNGVSGGIAPTVKPQGPVGSKKEPGMGSVAGAAAPGNVAGPGRPRNPGAAASPFSKKGTKGGPDMQYIACPFGGGDDCIKHGGNGATQHKSGGSIMQKHQEAMAAGAQPKTPEAKEAHQKQMEAGAKVFNAEPHPDQVVVDHLAEGQIGSIKKLGARGTGAESGGANDAFKITIVGNGSGLMKPHIEASETPAYLAAARITPEKAATMTADQKQKAIDGVCFPGAGTMPKGINQKAEVGAHKLSESLGLKIVPVTTMRHHDGKDGGPTGLTSVQHWQDDAISTDDYGGEGAEYKELLKAAPKEHRDKMHEQLSSAAVLDVIQNNGDRHFNNFMVHKKTHDIIAIDHGVCFGNGLSGMKNDTATQIHQSGGVLQIPPKMHERLKNMSLDDTMRSMAESGLPEWSKAQTFLRSKYVSHLQETHDHIPIDRIRSTVTVPTGGEMAYEQDWENKGKGAASIEHLTAKEEGMTPHQQFERFSKAWMEKAASDPTHKHHEDAKRLLAMKPLRDNKHASGREEATPEALEKHFAGIKSYDLSEPNADKAKADMAGRKTKPWDAEQQTLKRTPPEVGKKTPVVNKKKLKSAASADGKFSVRARRFRSAHAR